MNELKILKVKDGDTGSSRSSWHTDTSGPPTITLLLRRSAALYSPQPDGHASASLLRRER